MSFPHDAVIAMIRAHTMGLQADIKSISDVRDGPPTVLVVEDDADIRQFLCMLLELGGYVVRVAEHGQAALEDLRRHPLPCCILLDMRMPVMGGRAIRLAQLHDPHLASIPVIGMSAHAHIAEVVTDLHLTAYLTKPFTPDELLVVVGQMCH